MEAAEVPAAQGKVIPLRPEAADRKSEAPRERADAARNRVRILAATRELLRTRTPCELSIDEIAGVLGLAGAA